MTHGNISHEDDAEPSKELVTELLARREQFLAFVERRVGSRALAEDILQEAFVRGLDRLPGLREEEAAVAWFYRVLRNATTDYVRRRGAASRGLAALANELEAAPEPTPELKNAVCQCVAELAQTLKPEYAQALQRIEVEGLPVKAYAQEIGTSSNNAAVRVFRAREALRKQVTRACGACATHGCVDCTCKTKG
jgi:RNA polymerase sigma-70 factor (ECF subfamily)